ncbi:hypothetical protein JCGZ_12564 [Jatropha curcas]|uniref:Phytosulfokine n=2 Tax=Jatropha curcas TaxID=180498 RepID=A0A067KAQ8_JATCU|nr:hypothetical protein JCGZ_12564 [Jatropha curcas]
MIKVKVATLLFLAALLLCSILTSAGRREPAFSNGSSAQDTQQGFETEQNTESCEGVGEEECLMRRTLAAHIDYIYTQNHKP